MFFLMSGLLRLNKVDDPVHGIGIHISGGVVGTFLVGLSNLVVTRDGMSVVSFPPRCCNYYNLIPHLRPGRWSAW